MRKIKNRNSLKHIILIIFSSLLFANSAFAVGPCSTPYALVGTIKYFGGRYSYCGIVASSPTWILMQTSSTPGAPCAVPGLLVGDKFCNGTNYYSMSSGTVTTACSPSNTYKYISGTMYICAGGSFHATGGCSDCTATPVTCEDYGMDRTACEAAACTWTGFTCETPVVYCPTCPPAGGGAI